MPKKRCLDAGPGLQSSIEESEHSISVYCRPVSFPLQSSIEESEQVWEVAEAVDRPGYNRP